MYNKLLANPPINTAEDELILQAFTSATFPKEKQLAMGPNSKTQPKANVVCWRFARRFHRSTRSV